MDSDSDRLVWTCANLIRRTPTDSDRLRGTRNLNDFDESEKFLSSPKNF